MRAALLLSLVVVASAFAAPRVVGDTEVRAGGFAKLAVPGEPGQTVAWDDITPAPIQQDEVGGFLVFTGEPGTTYTVKALVIDFEKKTFVRVRHTVRFGGIVPPVPPPGPDPPKPPTPPTPVDPPIIGDGFRVLVLWESADLSKYPSAQVQAVTSAEVRDYCRRKCAKGTDAGKSPEVRVFDKDAAVHDEETFTWRRAFERAKKGTTLPWLLISNGREGYEGPLPANTAALMTLLKRYGGD